MHTLPLPKVTRQQIQFLLRVAPPALQSEREYEIPACITLAQAILESATPRFGWGSSRLFRLANNPFGIKYSHRANGSLAQRAVGSVNDRVSDLRTPRESIGLQKSEIGRSGDRVSSGPSGWQPLNAGEVIATVQSINGAGEKTESRIPNPEFKIPNPESRIPNPEFKIPNPESRNPNAESPTEDYGHFDVATWEFINGQKKEVFAQFQRFPDLTEAFKAHARLLLSPHYRPAYEVRHDWKQFAERLGPKKSQQDTDHCGYSTNPSYSALLIKLVNTYRLDDPRAQEWLSTGKDPGPVLEELLA